MKISSVYLHSETVRAKELKFERSFTSMCHLSNVKCKKNIIDKVLGLVVEGLLSTGPTPSSLLTLTLFSNTEALFGETDIIHCF